jgi:crotonobetainyl-CoA:carnitine CoA-transferase CaiB-like acyl-CoA transferase
VLLRLIRQSDVVIEASRPRALAQMEIDACGLVTATAQVRGAGPQIWVSITGYGRTHDDGQRVAFGDDAAAAGGLVVWHEDPSGSTGGATPLFCADAVADPITGLAAAGACLNALERGERCLLDVSMAGVCASLAGPTLAAGPQVVVADPRARQPARRAPALGADTDAVLAELSARER